MIIYEIFFLTTFGHVEKRFQGHNKPPLFFFNKSIFTKMKSTRSLLFILAFIEGACVMACEIFSAKMVAPFLEARYMFGPGYWVLHYWH